MNPLQHLFAILGLDPGILPPQVHVDGSIYIRTNIITAALTIRLPQAVDISRYQPAHYPQQSQPALPETFSGKRSTFNETEIAPVSNEQKRRLTQLRQWWDSLPSDQDRARAAGRLLGLED